MAKKDKFKIPSTQHQVSEAIKPLSKYRIGEPNYSFREILNLKPVFAFDYISMDQGDICFNSTKFKVEDFTGLLQGLKTISSISYGELHRVPNYRFHTIDFEDKRVSLISRKDFKSILTHKEELLPDEQLPTLYQFDLHFAQEARACGFIFRGVFYLVWYDRNHQIYPSNK